MILDELFACRRLLFNARIAREGARVARDSGLKEWMHRNSCALRPGQRASTKSQVPRLFGSHEPCPPCASPCDPCVESVSRPLASAGEHGTAVSRVSSSVTTVLNVMHQPGLVRGYLARFE